MSESPCDRSTFSQSSRWPLTEMRLLNQFERNFHLFWVNIIANTRLHQENAHEIMLYPVTFLDMSFWLRRHSFEFGTLARNQGFLHVQIWSCISFNLSHRFSAGFSLCLSASWDHRRVRHHRDTFSMPTRDWSEICQLEETHINIPEIF
jgi:hypothetical protein